MAEQIVLERLRHISQLYLTRPRAHYEPRDQHHPHSDLHLSPRQESQQGIEDIPASKHGRAEHTDWYDGLGPDTAGSSAR